VTLRRVALIVVLGVLLLLGVLITGRPERASESGPGGTLAFRRFLEESGVQVREETLPPERGTFVLLSDSRTPRDAQAIVDWVEEGGRLVLFGGGSPLAVALGVAEATDVTPEISTDRFLSPGCPVGEALGVRNATMPDHGPRLLPTSGAITLCFPDGGGGHLAVIQRGRGRAFVLSSIEGVTNRSLRRGDNALLALQLVGEGPAVFGPPVPPPASAGLWDILPRPAKIAVVQLMIAAGMFALVRARRLGRPVAEDLISPVPAGELVGATANLYRVSGDSAHAGRLIREGTLARLAARLGVPTENAGKAGPLLATHLGWTPDRARHLLTSETSSDEALVEMANDLEEEAAKLQRSAV